MLVWAYGKEIWCNTEGRYTHIVADWTGTPAQASDYEMSLCQLGIMGTEYIRQDSIDYEHTVPIGSVYMLTVSNIVSALAIGTDLNINLRLAEAVDYISFLEIADATEVYFDAYDLAVGSYEVVIESFDANSSV